MTFSALSYSKGASIIKMIANFITEETFNKGLTNYLNAFAYDNAEREDLWIKLDEAAKEDDTLDESLDISTIMETWTSQPGYPVVTVTSRSERMLTLEQKRFFINPNAADDGYMYYIPLTVAYPQGSFEDTKANEWLKGDQKSRQLEVDKTPYIINVQERSYYRVNYDEQNWQDIMTVLMNNNSDIHRLNRAQILDDSFNIARAGQLNYEVPLGLVQYLPYETDHIPTAAGMNGISYLNLMLRKNDQDYEFLKRFVIGLLEPNYNKLNFTTIGPDEKYINILYKRLLFAWMCRYDYDDCLSTAMAQFGNWRNSADPDNTNPISPDLKATVYDTGIRKGNSSDWEFLYDRFLKTSVAAERRTILYALGESIDPTLIRNYLGLSINPNSGIRKQDSIYVYRSVGSTKIGRRIQFDWVQERFDQINAYFGPSLPRYLDDMLNGFMDDASTQEEIDELNQFLHDKQEYLGSAGAIITKGIDNAETNKLWVSSNYAKVSEWLRNNAPETTTQGGTTSKSANINIMSTILASACFVLIIFAQVLH